MPRFYDFLQEALAEGEPFALGIISGIKGSSPQKKGAKAIFFADGRIRGTLGGGCLEAEIQDRARRALATGRAVTFDLILDHDFGWDDGLICGGAVNGLILPLASEARETWKRLAGCEEAIRWGVRPDYSIAVLAPDEAGEGWLYLETTCPLCQLWIAGSGHVAQAVAPLARELDFEVTIFDDRPALANAEHFPVGTEFRVGYWEQLLEEPVAKKPVYGLIMTRGHQHDALVLRHWIQRPFTFLGMIGSRRKARLIFSEFREQKIASEAQLASVSCPVGVPIQATTVPEIAVSVVAQLIQKRAEKQNEKVGGIIHRTQLVRSEQRVGG